MTMNADVSFMQLALEEARAAAAAGEVPIGALIVLGDKILARAGNRTIRDCDPTAHAEILVIREAALLLRNYRMPGTTLYVTIEPCSMCAGAIIQARIPRLVYGADDSKGGAVRSCFEVLSNTSVNHQVEVMPGVLVEDCASILQSFFAARR
jgi:tRNA(adenine34) deaminase